MKKIITLLTAFILLVATLSFFGCTNNQPLVIKQSDTYIVIKASKQQMNITEQTTLVDYMNSLKSDGEIAFELNNGMVCSVNGIANPADWSSCWMLYTSDVDNANVGWGTIEYNGEIYGSAVFGAETLKIKDGYLYIWVFQSFN